MWWQVRWPDPMWADDTVVSHPISFHRSEREGGWSSLNKVLAGCSSSAWRAHARQSVCKCSLSVSLLSLGVVARVLGRGLRPVTVVQRRSWRCRLLSGRASCAVGQKQSLPPVNWRWVEEGDGYVGRLRPPGQPLGVGLPSGLQCLVLYPYRATHLFSCTAMGITASL